MLILLLLLVLLLYTFAHESGHALVGLLWAGRITSFSVNFFNLSAHVGLDGSFTPAQNAGISSAGVVLPLLLCMGLILLLPKKVDPVLQWFRLIVFMAAVNALLAWIFIPILTLGGKSIGDDSANFLRYTHWPPLIVSGAVLLVYLACWALFLSRMGGLSGLLAQFRPGSIELSRSATQKTILSLAALGAMVFAATFLLTRAYPERILEPPAGYQLVAEINLSQNSYSDLAVHRFRLSEPSKVSFFFALQNVKGSPAKIQLIGPAGYENNFFIVNDPGFAARQASVNPQAINLEQGDYQVRVTFERSPGLVRAFIKVE
jgi:hypothetical protein